MNKTLIRNGKSNYYFLKAKKNPKQVFLEYTKQNLSLKLQAFFKIAFSGK